MSVDDVSFAIIALNVLGLLRLGQHETPAVAPDRRQLLDQWLGWRRNCVLIGDGVIRRAAAGG